MRWLAAVSGAVIRMLALAALIVFPMWVTDTWGAFAGIVAACTSTGVFWGTVEWLDEA